MTFIFLILTFCRREYLDTLSKKLELNSLEDWYKVDLPEVKKKIPSSLLQDYYKGSLVQALASIYPGKETVPTRLIPSYYYHPRIPSIPDHINVLSSIPQCLYSPSRIRLESLEV